MAEAMEKVRAAEKARAAIGESKDTRKGEEKVMAKANPAKEAAAAAHRASKAALVEDADLETIDNAVRAHGHAAEAANRRGDAKAAAHHTKMAQLHEAHAESGDEADRHAAAKHMESAGHKVGSTKSAKFDDTGTAGRVGGSKATTLGDLEAKAAKLKAFAAEGKKADKQAKVLMRGKKGGTYTMTKGGKKVYTKKG
jgi:hypothetical protein